MEKSADHKHANTRQQATETPERLKTMNECLKLAAHIRKGLEGRSHSDSTKLVAEERQR